MLIALLALLGVDLIVLVTVVAFVFRRKRWVMRQPGVFRGAIWVSGGEIDGLSTKWKRGYGRWVHDILVWTKAPFLQVMQKVSSHRIRRWAGRCARGCAPDEQSRHPSHI